VLTVNHYKHHTANDKFCLHKPTKQYSYHTKYAENVFFLLSTGHFYGA